QSHTRLAGAQAAVDAAQAALGGEVLAHDQPFWADIREQRHAFFAGDTPLWRLSLAPATTPLSLGSCADRTLEWGGAQRWPRPTQDADTIGAAVTAAGGHARCWLGNATPRFQPL